MTKLTVKSSGAPTVSAEHSPSAEIVAAATTETSIVDERGRTILLRKPGVLSQYRLIEALGPETARNEVYVQMVLPLTYVAEIDGQRVLPFKKKSDVEATVQRLDEDGIAAVMAGVNKHFGKPDPEADKVALGN